MPSSKNRTETIILVLNAGSSSLKASLFSKALANNALTEILHFVIANIAEKNRPASLKIKGKNNVNTEQTQLSANFSHAQSIALVLQRIKDFGYKKLDAVGHRIVHGGNDYADPILLNQKSLKDLKGLIKLAPQHQPYNLETISYLFNQHPNLPQIGCFDTGFHQNLGPLAKIMALPKHIRDLGIRRYGFHGLSYEYISQRIDQIKSAPKYDKLIIAHMGNGVSLCGLKAGKSQTTSMGFTALDGPIMGKRSGSIDPGVVFHLLEQENITVSQLKQVFYNESGLLGISGISNDMAILLASNDQNAKLAIDSFCFSINEQIGRLTANLGGVDAIIFTGGIGENANLIRQKICENAAWTGAKVDTTKNAQTIDEKGYIRLNTDDSKVDLWAIATNEELMIAQHALEVGL